MKKYQKGFAPIIILLIVLLLAGGIYLGIRSGKIPLNVNQVLTASPTSKFSPSVDSMADWKSYTTNSTMDVIDPTFFDTHQGAEKKTLTFRYPPGWTLIKKIGTYRNSNEPEASSGFYLAKPNKNEDLYCSKPYDLHCTAEGISPSSVFLEFDVAVFDDSDLFNVKYWGSLNQVNRKTNTVINGIPIEQAYGDYAFPDNTVFNLGKTKLRVSVSGLRRDSDVDFKNQTVNEMNLILSTIKFVN